MQKIRRGDLVQIVRGAERPQTAEDRKQPSGRVLSVDPVTGTCVVEGRNMVWKHRKGTGPENPGGRTQKEAPLQLSNVMVFNEAAARPERVEFRTTGGRKARYFAKSGTPVDGTGKGGK